MIMRCFFLLLLTISFLLPAYKSYGQKTDAYEQAWKKIDELIRKKNLPRSALAEVKLLYAKAKKEGQDAQVIKALVYSIGLQQETRESNEQLALAEVEKEISTSKEPAASLLKSLQAQLYWNYFQQHRWQLYNRTNTSNFKKEDVATWTAQDFQHTISRLFLQSIEKTNLLQQTKLDPYDPIIIKGNVRHLRPTLYDLLAHRALAYFKNDERDLHRPAFAFHINQPEAFAPAAAFVQATFPTKDSLSLQHKALLIYQELLRFHQNDAQPDALLDADIDRIQFVYQNSILENKDSLYVAALEQVYKQHKNNPVAAQAAYLLAAYYEQQAAQYHPQQDTTHRYARLKATKILEQAVADSTVYGAQKNRVEGWVNSYNLLRQITKPEFSFEVEKVNVPDQPFRALVKYKNVPALHFRLIKADRTLKELFQQAYEEKLWTALAQAAPLRQWQQPLPPTHDLQQHAVEIKVEALPVGEYILLASAGNDFQPQQQPLAARLLYVSNISYMHQGNHYFVLHRETGQPLANAAVQVYQQVYDYKASKYVRRKGSTYRTDTKGFVQLDRKREMDRHNYFISITHQSDSLCIDEPDYYSYYPEDTRPEQPVRTVFFFTDRSIYRPGQTLYFKGIVVNRSGKENSIAADIKTTVYLYDANGEKRDSLNVTTNEFGSFSGTFSLPQHLLNGEFRLAEKQTGSGVSISVEEYKRPRFSVAFDPVAQSYKVGDSISVTGNAKGYAGNAVSGARVVYRVIREARFLYPWLLKWGWWPRTQPMEIAQGETATTENGTFSIAFKAIPDKTIDPKLEPVFDYRIMADVTDLNGETRSGEEKISAGYKSLVLQVNLAERMAVDSFRQIAVHTGNMNGVFQPAAVTVNISKLLPPQRLMRARYWQQPDQFVMEEDEFLRSFPHDEYRNESEPRTWPKGATVMQRTDTSKANANFIIPNTKWETGFYEVVITAKDKDGAEVKDVRYMELFHPTKNEWSRPVYLWAKENGQAIEPGQKATVHIGTAAQDVFLLQQTSKQNGQPATEFNAYTLDNEKQSFVFPATEADRGGYGLSFFFVKHNRLYQFTDVIRVPWSNKELSIEYASFRNKTVPGSQETWQVKITGSKGEAVAAELLAGMYDAALDQFKPHQWQKPDLWPVYAPVLFWNGNQNFSAFESVQKHPPEANYKELRKQYDYLIFDNRQPGLFDAAQRLTVAEVALETKAVGEVLQGKAAGVAPPPAQMRADTTAFDQQETTGAQVSPGTPAASDLFPQSAVRKNFSETAFFFPHLQTGKDGAIAFSFTLPEAVTRWKLQALAHTKDLALGSSTKEVVTQKELMVQPNPPRFLRQGDRLEFAAKIVNLSDKELTGQVALELFDATTQQSVDGWFQNVFPNQYFTVAAGGSEAVKFPVEVPYLFNKPLLWRVVARTSEAEGKTFSDGEEAILPVLTNKTLVTETLPLPVRGAGTKHFTFQKLLQAGESETLQHHTLTVEYTANPAWYAVQALPYLAAYPYEGAEQIWNRYYANALAAHLVRKTPRIKKMIEQWSVARGSEFHSDSTTGNQKDSTLFANLQKNSELKSALLAETPWVLEAKTEAEQRKNIALLFDALRMAGEQEASLQKLMQLQSPNGGFVWFRGGPDDRYITQYIVTGIGRLQQTGALNTNQQEEVQAMLNKALSYLDQKIKEDYEQLLKQKTDLKKQNIRALQVQYLYLRSFFPHLPVSKEAQTAAAYFRRQAQQFWMRHDSKQLQGMTALALHRSGDAATPKAILRSLKETAIVHDELGMYWKENSYGYSWRWWHAPIETQALLIETFSEMGNDTKVTDDLKTWLLKNKQTSHWRTTKATADAVYALLQQGSDWLSHQPQVVLNLGTQSYTIDGKEEEATGLFKHTIDGTFVKPELGNISITVQPGKKDADKQGANQPSWGAVYWQYFEDLDKITTAATPLQLSKKLFVEQNTDRGPVLTPVDEGTAIGVGNKLRVRIELRVDRDMEYVHLKDLRASALEPVNVLSGYKWQDGLGYYETTKDLSTSFFFPYLPKGTYVFEYPVWVTHTGNFSNGITTAQCLYAPEFSAHSEGVRIRVE